MIASFGFPVLESRQKFPHPQGIFHFHKTAHSLADSIPTPYWGEKKAKVVFCSLFSFHPDVFSPDKKAKKKHNSSFCATPPGQIVMVLYTKPQAGNLC